MLDFPDYPWGVRLVLADGSEKEERFFTRFLAEMFVALIPALQADGELLEVRTALIFRHHHFAPTGDNSLLTN